ncbi:MAG: hypothetical protein IKW80_03720 [Thermoguttaceae bacterium]|nr:hypothetical protein [Thermoguttaceae bacterium]
MNDDILTTAVKIAKIIDDGVDRDNALSRIAQVQAAINYADDAWETISQIRYVDIRAEALRRSLDNQLTWYILKKETMPELDLWIEKLMEETLAIPNIRERCSNLQSIILFILPRLDDKETALSMAVNARNEFAQLKNIIDRSKYLFTACEMFLQLNNFEEATATIELIQERISEIRSPVEQGLLLGLLAHEYWKMQDYMSAFECIGCVENRKIQSYAYLQLVEALSNGGQFNDAESIVEQQEEKKQKNLGNLLISMGKNVFRSFPQNLNNIVFNLNKSYVFCNELDAEDSFDSDPSQNSDPLRRPTWVNHLMVIKSAGNENDKAEQSESDSNADNERPEFKILQENQIESYVQFVSSETNDSDEDDDDDGESWKDSDDDDDGESWKDSDDDDDGESWKDSDDDDEGEEWKRSSDVDENDDNDEEDVDDDLDNDDVDDQEDDVDNDKDDERPSEGGDKHDIISDFINNKMDQLPFPEKIRKLHELFLERVINLNRNLNDFPKEKYFCLMETSLGIITFNQTLPPKMLQRLLRKIFILIHSIKSKKKEIETLFPQDLEKVDEFSNRTDEIGFDDAWQEVISQGDYKFAVESALNYYCYNHKKELFFGCEYLYPNR